MDETQTALILQLMTTAIMVFGTGGFFLVSKQRKKLESESGSLDVQSDVAMSAEVREWARDLRKELLEVKKEAHEANSRGKRLEKHVEFLEDWIRSQGMTVPEFIYEGDDT